MAKLEDFVNGVINNGIAAKSEHEQEINKLADGIKKEEQNISDTYTEIGKAYYKLNPDDTQGELGKLVKRVNGSNKKIKDSKMKIGELLGFTFCAECGEQVDDDALFCNNCGSKMPVKLMPGMVLCQHCNKAVKKGFRFCTNCGEPMTQETKSGVKKESKKAKAAKKEKEPLKKCPNCGFTTNDPEKDFCDDCGRRLEGGNDDALNAKVEEKKVPTKKVCTNCGFTVFDIETMFCDDCGRRLVEADELEQK